MKKILFLTLLASVFATSCFEDKGSYDYTSMDVVDLQEILDNTVFTVGHINTEYFVEVDVPDEMAAEYDFYWEYVTDTEAAELVGIVCEGKDLDFMPRMLGNISMYFVAVNKAMKTEQYVEQTITISPQCGQGWLLLGRRGGESTLSFAEPASSASGNVAKIWTPYKNFVTGLPSDADKLLMQYGQLFDVDFSYINEAALWVGRSNGQAAAYSSESYEVMTDLAGNRAGVVAGDQIETWKDMLPAIYASFLLEESGHVYLKYQSMLGAKFADSPLEYEGEPFLVEKLIYPNVDGMARFINDAFYPVIAIGKEGKIKLIDASKMPFYGNATTGNISNMYSIADKSGKFVEDFPDLKDANILGGMYYRAAGTYHESFKASIVNILYKIGEDYSMISFRGSSYDRENGVEKNYAEEYEVISIDNSAGYLSDEPIKLVSGANDDGAFSYFVSGSDVCILSRQGQLSKLYTASDKIVSIDVNPQKTEVGVALVNGTFEILDIEDLNDPVVVNTIQYDVDEIVDMIYKYSNYDDALASTND